MTKPITKECVIGIEPKHITYVKDKYGAKHDLLVVKEKFHLNDRDEKPTRIRMYHDYQRPFYITKPGYRKHQQKRDAELLEHLNRYQSTDVMLPENISKALGMRNAFGSLRMICRSPYVYGADVTASCDLKHRYQERFPDLVTFNAVAATDIENNMLDGSEDIILQSLTLKEQGVVFFLRSWIGDTTNLQERFEQCADMHIGEHLRARNMRPKVIVCDTPAEIVMEAAKLMHKWSPDFVTAWNYDHEIKHFERTLNDAGIDPAEVFSDPKVPENFRVFNYVPGQAVKESQSGKRTSKDPADRWGWVTHPASFQFMDSMTVYRALRLAGGKEPSYTLEAILQKELKIGKLRFKEAEKYSGLRWHEMMQQHWKLEYAVYNLFDSLSLELLDDYTKDLAMRVTTTSGPSDYKNLNSNPKRLCDAFHFWYLAKPEGKKVIAASSDQQFQEIDKYVVSPDGFIITLPSHFMAPEGLRCIKGAPDLTTLVYTHVADQLGLACK